MLIDLADGRSPRLVAYPVPVRAADPRIPHVVRRGIRELHSRTLTAGNTEKRRDRRAGVSHGVQDNMRAAHFMLPRNKMKTPRKDRAITPPLGSSPDKMTLRTSARATTRL
jgi:hypothetical protein